MGMLARRSIQKLLDQSHAYLSTAHVKSFVRRLNQLTRDALEAEWELVALASLATLGRVEHEPDLGGRTRLDVRFTSATMTLVADVRTVSDETFDRENPVAALAAAFAKVADGLRAEGIHGGFDFRVGAIGPSFKRREYKTRLMLPPTQEFRAAIFNPSFQSYLDRIRQAPSEAHHHVIDTQNTAVSIVFNPGTTLRSIYHPSYNVAHDAVNNIIRHALERKANQVKQSGSQQHGCPAGIILADGGCSLFRQVSAAGTVSLDHIVRTFLASSHSIHFVCALDVHASANWWRNDPLRFEARVWAKTSSLAETLHRDLNKGLAALPQPVRTAINAVNHLRWTQDSPRRQYMTYKRDTTMTDRSIELSMRAAIDYIAGRIDRAEFERAVHPDWLAHLRRNLEQGRAITNVQIAPYEDEDDDGLVITFGPRNAAAVPFWSGDPKET